MTERELLAAEMALRLLEGEELLDARRRMASDPGFVVEVADWEQRLAGLADEIGDVPPDAAMWARIHAAIEEGSRGGSVIQLHRRVRVWRLATGASVAAALALAFAQFGLEREPVSGPPAAAPAPVLVASLTSETEPTSLAATYLPDSRALVLAPGRLDDAPGRDRELWIIPEGQQPVSLGVLRGGATERRVVPAELTPHFSAGATLALSDEPTGGSPTGQPTGPVIAAGSLSRA